MIRQAHGAGGRMRALVVMAVAGLSWVVGAPDFDEGVPTRVPSGLAPGGRLGPDTR